MLSTETPEQVCTAFGRRLALALRRANRTHLRWSADLFDLHITVGSRAQREGEGTVDEAVPECLRDAPNSVRGVYKVIVALRAELGGDVRVTPAQIVQRQQADWDAAGVFQFASIHTVNHALADLRECGAVHTTKTRGYLLGPEPVTVPSQLRIDFGARLPFSRRQSGNTCTPDEIGHDAHVEHDSRAWHQEAFAMKTYIWVPIDPESGAVIDARTDKRHAPNEKVGEIKFFDRVGRLKTRDATRAELVRVEDKYAVVRLGREHVRILILGDWHVAGDTAPPAEVAEVG
jgi:hypothetical protein